MTMTWALGARQKRALVFDTGGVGRKATGHRSVRCAQLGLDLYILLYVDVSRFIKLNYILEWKKYYILDQRVFYKNNLDQRDLI